MVMLVYVVLSTMFLAALWSPAGKGLNSWLSCMLFFLCFVTFPNHFKIETSLSPPVKVIVTDHSKAMLLLWIFFVIYVSGLSCCLVIVCLVYVCIKILTDNLFVHGTCTLVHTIHMVLNVCGL